MAIQRIFVLAFTAALCAQAASSPIVAGLIMIEPPEPPPGNTPGEMPRIPVTPKPKNVPLKSIFTKATVRAWAYDVTSTLSYINNSTDTIECQFVFPVPDTAAVYKFEATIGDRVLRAEVKERNEAEAIYTEAVESGQRAGLLQSQEGSPDVYRVMLGNMAPHESATVVIAYAMPIERKMETGHLAINLPVVLNPRYIPRSDSKDPEEMIRRNFHATVPYVAVSEIPYTLNFTADIDLGVGGGNQIKDIVAGNASDELRVTTDNDNRTAQVVLTSKFNADHDFRLVINVTQELKTKVFGEAGQRSTDEAGVVAGWLNYDVAAAWFEPIGSVADGLSTDEYWLVVDRSGSMSGEKIRNAATALTYFIKSLPIGCTFNVIGFGSHFDSVFSEGAVEYTDDNVDLAMDYASSLDADFGGTEVLRPLQHIYAQKMDSTKRFIVLLTDGEVSNTQAVINAARQNADTTRVFAVGIGQGVSTALVNGVTRVSNGVAEYVRSSNDNLQAKVIDLLKITRTPSAEKVTMSWPEQGFTVAMTTPNKTLRAAFQGREIMQFAVLQRHGSNSITGESKLSAVMGGKSVSAKVSFTISGNSELDDPMPLHRIAAKTRLTELTDAYESSQGDQREQHKSEAIAISIATGVLCEFTSIVAVDDSGSVVNDSSGNPVFVNIERPTEYDMFGGGILSPMLMSFSPVSAARGPMARPPPRPAPMPSRRMRPAVVGVGAGGGSRGASGYSARIVSAGQPGPPGLGPAIYAGQPGRQGSYAGLSGLPPPPPPPSAILVSADVMAEAEEADDAGDAFVSNVWPSDSDLDALIRLQRATSGSWQLNDDFVRAVAAPQARTVDDLRDSVQTAIEDKAPGASDNTLATLTGVAVLRKRLQSRQGEWDMIGDKALAFLRGPSSGIEADDIDEFVESIANALAL